MNSPAFLLFGNEIPDNDSVANLAAQKLLKFADQFYEWALPRLPNTLLNYGMGLEHSSGSETRQRKRAKSFLTRSNPAIPSGLLLSFQSLAFFEQAV